MPPQLLIDYSLGGKKEKRRQEWNDIVQKNPQLLQDEATYNSAVKDYMRTGIVPAAVRTGREARTDITPKVEGTTDEGVPITTFPTTEVRPEKAPIRLAKGYTLLNKETGDYRTISDIPAGNEVLTYDPTVTKSQASQLYVFDPNGKLIRTMPWKGSEDHTVVLSREPAPRQPPRTPEDEAHRLALAQFYHAASAIDRKTGNPLPITPEIQDAAILAAQHFGLPWRTVQEQVNKPGFIGWLERTIPGGESGRVTADTLKIGGDVSAPSAPAATGPAPAAGAQLSEEQALQLLEAVGGDKERARAAARAMGYKL
jgi:hypothetical protein